MYPYPITGMRTAHLSLVIFSLLSSTSATFQPSGAPFKSPVVVGQGLVADVIFSNLTAPRGIAFDSLGNLLVVERGFGVTAFSPATGGYNRDVVIPNTGFTHGIQVDGKNLYVSTAGSVILYDYDASSKSVSSLTGRVLINGIPPDGELTTHTLQIEFVNGSAVGLLVGSGPLTNIDETARDPSSGRSQVRRFPLLSPVSPATPLPWSSGRVIAYGIRNPAGFAFSPASAVTQGLYIVENGASIDNVTGLTPAFVNDNPADELEILAPGVSSSALPKFFGFPDCSTLWNPQADPSGVPQYVGDHRGDQFSLHLDPVRDDQWCRQKNNNAPPKLSFQAHSVPLDIKFYLGPQPTQASQKKPLPTAFVGDSFVSFHGSFDRNPPTGYGVVR
ncbi:hypothetical protein E1B28_005145 [Marasmius oreades]|nr:uncharacterized protein E1B28_005145 [Marasmius oreades]KAG7097828.1 hypothetical protein E1B28_005145 [Marasmius oreades]